MAWISPDDSRRHWDLSGRVRSNRSRSLRSARIRRETHSMGIPVFSTDSISRSMRWSQSAMAALVAPSLVVASGGGV